MKKKEKIKNDHKWLLNPLEEFPADPLYPLVTRQQISGWHSKNTSTRLTWVLTPTLQTWTICNLFQQRTRGMDIIIIGYKESRLTFKQFTGGNRVANTGSQNIIWQQHGEQVQQKRNWNMSGVYHWLDDTAGQYLLFTFIYILSQKHKQAIKDGTSVWWIESNNKRPTTKDVWFIKG